MLQEAERAGINIDQRSVALKELQACMLAGGHLIIALVDKRRLCSGRLWSRSAALQLSGVNAIPMCGYGDAYTGKVVAVAVRFRHMGSVPVTKAKHPRMTTVYLAFFQRLSPTSLHSSAKYTKLNCVCNVQAMPE